MKKNFVNPNSPNMVNFVNPNGPNQYLAIGKKKLKKIEIPLNDGNSKYFKQIV
jgi:hypothetical protein